MFIATDTHTRRDKAFFMEAGWESPTKTPGALSAWPVPSTTPWTHRNCQRFCPDQAALPTTAAAKEGEGKPGYGQQPKIGTIYKNQVTLLVLVYKNIVCTQSWCLPRGYLWTQLTADVFLSKRITPTTLNYKRVHNPFWMVNIQCDMTVFNYRICTTSPRTRASNTPCCITEPATAIHNQPLHNWSIVSTVALCCLHSGAG